MGKLAKMTASAAALCALCGCFVLSQSEYPEVEMSKVDSGAAVGLTGFDATVTTYVPVYGYETVYHMGPYRRHWGPYATTYATETYIPQSTRTSAFIDRAGELLEQSGCLLRTENPDYTVDVRFSGPIVTDGEKAAGAAWTLFSLLTADYGCQTWTAKLKIYDAKEGRLLMFNDYAQRYSALVWGPIPLFSPAGSDKTSYNMMQSWCLTALTDRTMADATAFLAARAAEKAEKKE